MPHIRVVTDESDGQGAVYINGTKVIEESPLDIEAVLAVLADNLGYDAKAYVFDPEELEGIYEERDYELPDQLHEFGELIDEKDRTLGKGLFSPEED